MKLALSMVNECIICAIQKRKSDLLNVPEYLNCLKMFFEYPDKILVLLIRFFHV